MKQMRKNFSNERLSQAVAFEAANRAMNRKVMEYLKGLASGKPKATKATKVVEPAAEGVEKPKKAVRAKKVKADEADSAS
jgi:hypothetical protein